MSPSAERAGVPPQPAPARETSRILRTVFDGLDRAGVTWALLRGREELGADGGDVDLLVRADDLPSFEDVVFELGAYGLPRMRVPGSWSQAVLRPPWHHFYVVSDPSSGTSVKLDVVTRLVYNKRVRLESDLEHGCLERRLVDDGVYVLEPTDGFWTVLLHCLLDKQHIAPHRAAELDSIVGRIRRPSPGEVFFDSVCPSGHSADTALSALAARDWDALADLGRLILRRAGSAETAPSRAPGPVGPRQARRQGSGVGKSARARLSRALRTAAVSTYPVLWRRAGLGVVPRILDVVEAGKVDATVLDLRRRPGRCDVVILVPEDRQATLRALLRTEHFVEAAGRWHRLTGVGVERIRLVTAEQLALSAESAARLRSSSAPMAGRTHCRRAVGPLLS